MERRRQPPQQRGRAPNDVVAVCKAYSERLKVKPVRVKLHVGSGRLADGTIGLESADGAPNQLVVQAKGSNLFGLVKREIRHAFKVGELERSRSTHTAFLLRSIKQLSKGNEPLKEELLAKSLSLVRKNEAVDLTFATENECNKLGDWIDAKWSVAMIQKSFRGNPRINLALQGKNQSLNDQGVYEALENSRSGSGEGGHPRKGLRGRRRRRDEVDGAGFGLLPILDAAAKSKLQDDLLDGVHVTYHDLSMRGFLSTSSPRRLRFDCKSKAGLVYLEPSFEGDGKTIALPISSLIQVGGGPSAHGPTASLLRATGDNIEQRATAVSLVFSERSMDITCGSEKDAVELVLFFSEVKGFTRAKPPDRSLLCISPASEAGGHRGGPRTAVAVHEVGAAMLDMASATDALDVDDPLGWSAPPTLAVGAEADARSPAYASDAAADPLGISVPSFSSRFRSGYGKAGADVLLEKQPSAASGFHASESLRKISAAAARPAGGGGGGGVAQQRAWATHRGATSSKANSAFTKESIAAGAPAFHSTPGPARRFTVGGAAAVDSLERSGGGQPQRRRTEGGAEKCEHERKPQGRQHHQDRVLRGSPADNDPPPPYRSPPRYDEPPPAYDEGRGGSGGGGGGASTFVAPAHQDREHKVAAGELPRRRSPTSGSRSPASRSRSPAARSKSPVSRSRSPASREVPKEPGGGRRNTLGDTTGAAAIAASHLRGATALPGRARGPAGTIAPPPLPAREGTGGGGGGGGDLGVSGRQQNRANLHAVFPGRARGPAAKSSPPPLPARGGGGGGVQGGGDGGGTGGSDSHHRPSLHSQFPARARGPVAATAGSREEGRGGAPGRPGLSPARQPAPFSSAAEMRASTSVADPPAGRSNGGDVDRSGKGGRGRGGGGRRHTMPPPPEPDRSRPAELGDLEDDENYTTVRVKGTTPSPTSSDVDKSGSSAYGRRRASAPTMDRSGRGHDGASSSTPTKDRQRKSGGLTKALRGKLFASSQGSSGSRTPSSSTSISPVPGTRGSGGLGTETSSSGSGSARTRMAAFLTNPMGGMNNSSVGGVDGFGTVPSPTSAQAGRFRSSPGPPTTMSTARPASQASFEAARHARPRSYVP